MHTRGKIENLQGKYWSIGFLEVLIPVVGISLLKKMKVFFFFANTFQVFIVAPVVVSIWRGSIQGTYRS